MCWGPPLPTGNALNKPLSVDPITFEIIRHKLAAINEEQALALKAVSVSPIVAGAGDFNNALFTADGRLASMGPQVVFHSGAMPIILRHVMEDFADEEFADGDMYIVNDPYKGAVHHPDVTIMAPLFFRGATGCLGRCDRAPGGYGRHGRRFRLGAGHGKTAGRPDDAADAYRRKR